MSEYVSPLDNESNFVRLFRAIAFFVGGLALIDLSIDQLAKSLGGFFAESVTGPTLWEQYTTTKETDEGEKPDAT